MYSTACIPHSHLSKSSSSLSFLNISTICKAKILYNKDGDDGDDKNYDNEVNNDNEDDNDGDVDKSIHYFSISIDVVIATNEYALWE